LKYDVGFWRPIEAIHEADTDGNDGTTLDPDWAPLTATPPYPDYLSGHGSITAPFATNVRRMLGDDIPLVLKPTPTLQRSYPTLTALERDAFMARIWSGLHFRDAMHDAYSLGHRTARLVIRTLD
jgi:hypothetical protein